MPLSKSDFTPVAGGAVLLAAPKQASLERFRFELQRRLTELRGAIGEDVETRLGVRYDADPLAAVYGERPMAPADAILDFAMPRESRAPKLAERLGALKMLADCADLARSALGVGQIYHIHRFLPEGGEVLTFLGRKASGITHQEMLRWWLEDHAALALKLQHGVEQPWSYAQLHVDHAASERASEATGIPAEYDMGDIIAISDRRRFLGWAASEEVGPTMAADEVGHLDQSSWRGGLVQVVEALP